MSTLPTETCPAWLDTALVSYDHDLVSLISALERLVALATAGRTAAAHTDFGELSRLGEERGDAMADIARIEGRIEAARQHIAGHLQLARLSVHFAVISSRHREGERLVSDVLALDGETLALLDHAERHRRDVALAIETGEATLAAYRRVVTPPLHSAGLVDQRG